MTDDANPAVSLAGSTLQGQQVAAHWTRLSLTFDGAMQALQAQGIAPGQATADDLYALDMNHMGGLAATDALAEMAHLRRGQRVLDVGAGVGGPARRMAHKYGARVWGVELSEAVYQTAVRLTTLVGLQDQVQFHQGSALALPFADGAFDVVVMQHVAMQIAEKDQLFGECVRVLTGGGVLALHEIFAGEVGRRIFPWRGPPNRRCRPWRPLQPVRRGSPAWGARSAPAWIGVKRGASSMQRISRRDGRPWRSRRARRGARSKRPI